LLHSYRVKEVVGDRFSGGWCASEFERCRIKYKPSDKSKSKLYLACLPEMLAGKVALLDHERLRRQFGELERRVHSGNRESVDHRRGRGDDLANCVAGLVVLATAREPKARFGAIGVDGVVHWHDPEPRDYSRIRFVTVDELGDPLTPEQVQAIRHQTPPGRKTG
jgi:hypothetical protein